MTLPAAITEAIIAAVVKAVAKEITERMLPRLDELELFTIRDVAERLKVSQAKAKRLMAEHVELGEATRRYRLSTLQRVIEQRTISRPVAGLTTRHQNAVNGQSLG
jgi:hypothetical protein